MPLLVALATYGLGIFVVFGIDVFVAQYLQLVLGFSPLRAGLWSVPSALGFIAGSMLAPVLVPRIRPVFAVVAGLTIAASATFAHDIWFTVVKRQHEDERMQVLVARITAASRRVSHFRSSPRRATPTIS